MISLEPEERKGYVVSAEMKKVWQVQLALVRKLLEVCDKHHLRIWADGGTLLGTVREHGYIPWDDDIDMAMLRPDYDKLVSLAAKEFDHPYFFQCGYTEKVYPRGYARLRMDGTTAITPSKVFLNTHQGIFVDIFPYDAMPNDKARLDDLIADRNQMIDTMTHVAAFDGLHPVRSIGLLKYRSRFGELYNRFEDLFRSNPIEDCDEVSCLSFIVDPVHFFRDKHWYDETVHLPFEDIEMPVPGGYHEILTKQYGEYMTPVQTPSYHGGFWKLDAETGYETYLPELKRYIKRYERQRSGRRMKKLLNKATNKKNI